MKTSLVVTTLNEEKTIELLLHSIFAQTKKPDEIIVVDAGSTDRTVLLLNKSTLKLTLLIEPGSTISQGRNKGIGAAKNDIIVMTDAGCIAHKDWFEKITKPFNTDSADIVAGFYKMTGDKPIQRALAPYLGIPPERFNPNSFLPSARSIAFKKSLWKKIGGFDESLERAGEDTLFNYRAIRLSAKFIRVKNAVVDWEVPDNLYEGFRKFFVYAKGDLQSGIWWHPNQRISTHNLKIASIFGRYLLGFILLVISVFLPLLFPLVIFGSVFYLFWSVWKMRDVVRDGNVRLLVPVVQVTSDLAVITGAISGLLTNF